MPNTSLGAASIKGPQTSGVSGASFSTVHCSLEATVSGAVTVTKRQIHTDKYQRVSDARAMIQRSSDTTDTSNGSQAPREQRAYVDLFQHSVSTILVTSVMFFKLIRILERRQTA